MLLCSGQLPLGEGCHCQVAARKDSVVIRTARAGVSKNTHEVASRSKGPGPTIERPNSVARGLNSANAMAACHLSLLADRGFFPSDGRLGVL